MRSEFLTRFLRAGAVWLVLVALALPGFALARGICCEFVAADEGGCCASAVEGMAGMQSSSMAAKTDEPVVSQNPIPMVSKNSAPMASMGEGFSAGARAAADLSTGCSSGASVVTPEAILDREDGLRLELVSGCSATASILAGQLDGVDFAEGSPLSRVRETTSKLFLFDPLAVSLRI